MQHEEIIKQLKNITIDQTEYNKKGHYYEFITARNEYLYPTEPLLPSRETRLLLKMINCLTKWIVINNRRGERRYNPFLSQRLSARKDSLMENVPKILHFVCLCKITDIQRDYIDLWIQNNPDYEINIWMDENALLAQELAIRIQKKASKQALIYANINFDDFKKMLTSFLKVYFKDYSSHQELATQEKIAVDFFKTYFYEKNLNIAFDRIIKNYLQIIRKFIIDRKMIEEAIASGIQQDLTTWDPERKAKWQWHENFITPNGITLIKEEKIFQDTITRLMDFMQVAFTGYINHSNQFTEEKKETVIFEKYELEIEFSFNTRAKSIIDEFILNFDNMELFKPDEVHIIKNTFYTWKKNVFARVLLHWQDKSYKHIKMIKGGNSIDDGIIDFCKKYQLGEEEELEKIIINNENNLLTTRTELNSANPKSNIHIINKNPDYDFYRYYLVELILRGNLISASNIICLEILNEYGGVYLSTDLLPAINENLFRYLIDKTSEDPEGIQNQAIIIKFILNELVQDGKMLGRTKKPIDGMDSKKKAAIQVKARRGKTKKYPAVCRIGKH